MTEGRFIDGEEISAAGSAISWWIFEGFLHGLGQ